MLLLPHLPEGSTYTGIDFAEDLIQKGKTLFELQKIEADFLLGLIDVDVRMNDKVEFVTTQFADYSEAKHDFITYNDWTSGISKKEKDKLILHLLTHGLSHKEAEDYCNRNIEIANFFSDNPDAGYTFMKGHMISYGKKANPSA